MKRILLPTLGILLAIGVGPHASAQKPKAKAAVEPRTVGLDGTLTWSGAGDQTWANGEIVGFADMNEIKTEVDACFSSQDGGTFSAGNMSITGNFSAVAGAFTGAVTAPSFTADASATPQLIFDDSVATGNEAIVRGDAVADNNGRLELLVESTAAAYKSGVTVCSVTGVAKTLLGPNIDASAPSGAGGCLTPLGDGVVIPESGILAAVGNGGVSTAALSGSIATANMPAKFRTRICDFNIEAPVTGDDGVFQCYLPNAATLVRVYCSTTTGTSNIALYERTEATATASGSTTNILSAEVACNADGTPDVGTISDAAMAADALLTVGIKTPFTSGVLRVHVEYTID